MNAARRGLVEIRCKSRAISLRRGDFRTGGAWGFPCGLCGCFLGNGNELEPLGGDSTCVGCLSSAELFLVDGVELPESELRLKRRVLTGIRD